MAEFVVEFEAIDNAFGTEFEGFTPVSDGGFERGYQDGYADALSKRTDLVVTENGEYAPSEGSTGFKSVKVDVAFRSPFDDYVEGNTTELSSGASKVADSAFVGWTAPKSANFPNAVTIGKKAFNNAALESVNFPSATNIANSAFSGCSKLVSANFPSAESISTSAFESCSSLKNINFPKVEHVNSKAFMNCSDLESVVFPNATTVNSEAFRFCDLLTVVDLPSVINILQYAFAYGYSLKSVILRSETMCNLSDVSGFNKCYHIHGTVNATHNPNGDKDGYFYVPRALLSDDDAKKDYRRATNWSNFATQFRALEDYTVDGTITGELDPNKI
jgi:hypothetical protein